jgi:undecaprenyl diphosphate synthase
MSDVNHVAIIMDGNGRWATERSRPRFWGHVRGSANVSKIVETAEGLGIKALTLYAFSTENWKRPDKEVSVLFNLLRKFLLRERPRILKNNIKFKIIGDITKLPEKTKKLITDLEEETQNHKGLKLSFAFSYGSQKEIIDSVNQFIEENPGKKITKDDFEAQLLTQDLGDVDLLIRTGGDQRISNFLLWQIAYAELYFSEIKWPAFTPSEFTEIYKKVARRERRFGGIIVK